MNKKYFPVKTERGNINLIDYPNTCPFCHKSITPNLEYTRHLEINLEVLFTCPNVECDKGFLAYYDNKNYDNEWEYNGNTTQGKIEGKIFTEIIEGISSSFIDIYNQAYAAEQYGLIDICGVGYRKALEFLIKDYAIQNKKKKKTEIEHKQLSVCINDYINDANIKSVSKRAVWLGNDETHYTKKWENKNLNDLKVLIDLTIYWIQTESLTKYFEKDMTYEKSNIFK